MTRFAALVAVGLLALTGTAAAATNGAKVYRATLAPVAVGATAPTGKAHLVDGKKNNIVTIHAKGLTPGTSYPWHIHAFAAGVVDPCAPGAAQGPIETSFAYGPLTGNEAGNGSAKGKSATFNWGAATNQYYVNIHDPVTGAPIACGVLTGKAPKPHPQGKQRGFERH
jgi:Cu/Zn superoxide dismutase